MENKELIERLRKINFDNLNKDFKALRFLQPKERFILLIQHVIDNECFINEIDELRNDVYNITIDCIIPIYDVDGIVVDTRIINKPLYFEIKQELDLFDFNFYNYKLKLYKEFDMVYSIMSNIYYIDNEMVLTNYSKSVFNNSSFIITPFVYSFERWKALIYYELEIIKNKELIKPTIDKFIYTIKDLKYRLGTSKIPTMQTHYHSITGEENLLSAPVQVNTYFDFSFHDNNLDNYINFLKGIDSSVIIKNSVERLNLLYKKEEEIRQRIKKKKRKINVLKSVYKIKRAIVILTGLQNKNIDQILIEETSKKIISSLFDCPNTWQTDFIIPKNIKFDKNILIDVILLFEKNGYIDTTKTSITNILKENVPFNYKGFTVKNIYYLIQKRRKLKILEFKGVNITENYLLNEMNY